MTLENQLKDVINRHYSSVIDKFKFQLKEKTHHEGMGALHTYQNQELKLRIVNDRGITNADIASPIEPDTYFSIEVFASLIKLSEKAPGNLDNWERKMIICKQLSCEEEAGFLEEYYYNIVDLVSEKKFAITKEKLDAIGNEHAHIQFGRPFNTDRKDE